jgi:hypothetical protein
MEELISEILKDPALVAGLPLTWDTVPENNQRVVLKMALHCVINGPVGVNKTTRFPLIQGGETRIKDAISVSNKSWKGFCLTVAQTVKRLVPDLKCSAREACGDFWPIADWPKKEIL